MSGKTLTTANPTYKDMNPILITLIALALGLLIGWLLARVNANRHEQQLSSDLAVAQAQIKSQQQLDQERQTALQLSMERLAAEFDEVAGSSLRANNETFFNSPANISGSLNKDP